MREARLSVLLDRQIFVAQRRGGVSRYFVELARQFDLHPELGVDLWVPAKWSINDHLHEFDAKRFRTLGGWADGSRVRRVVNRAARWTGTAAPRGWRQADILHHTYYSPEVIARTPGIPRVITVHDMIHELFPDLPSAAEQSKSKRSAVEAADAIICVSRTTRDDLVRLWGSWINAPIHVIHHGVGVEFTPGGPAFRPGYDYILYVGTRRGYKAFSQVVEALSLVGLEPDSTELHLICVGGGRFDETELKLIRELGLQDRVHQSTATQMELPCYYRGARSFVFPSRYEGLGLPLLESMACGCRAVVADVPAFAELGEDTVEYFPPGDVSALAALIRNDDRVRDWSRGTMRESAISRAGTFSWEKAADATADVYRQIRQEA